MPVLDRREARSFLVPARVIRSEEEKAIRDSLAARLIQDSIDSALGRQASDFVVRDILPLTDLPTTFANQDWLTAALVANTEFTFVNQVLATTRVLGIYGIVLLDANPSISAMYFRVGATGGSTLLAVGIQHLWAELQLCGYLGEAVIYKPQDNIFIRAHPVIAKAAGERIVLRGLVCEPRGPNVS